MFKLTKKMKKMKKQHTLIVSYNCHLCHKKISALYYGFLGKCKCQNYYCYQHKFPEDHKCTYDYKSEQKEKLEKDLPLVVADKAPNRI